MAVTYDQAMFTLLLLLGALALRAVRRKTNPLPPGPHGLPFLGNLFDFPTQGFDWVTYGNWADQYGPVISLSAPGTTVIVINSWKKAIELMDKKSTKYSSRPYLTMAIDLMGWQNAFAFTKYGPRFRGYRKVFHEQLGNAKAIGRFYPQEEDHAKKFVRHCLQDPSHLMEHCFQHAGAIILRVAYGYVAKDENDDFINVGNTAMDSFNQGCSPSRFMVNQIPILRFVPEWMPGAGFQKIAREWRGLYDLMIDTPFDFVKKQLALGTAEDSFTANWLGKNPTPLEEDILKNAAGSMFGGGGETTAVTVQFYFLVLLRWPEVQAKLHAEMDAVVGRDRLPTFKDRENLPYLEAVTKEILRHFPSVPNGLAHCTTEDDIHDGYFIPKGALVISNIWKMTRDPTVYPKPEDFKPERFLGPNQEQDPKEVAFGFGRRICPGRFLADVSVYITLAMCAFSFDVKPVVENGKEIIPDIKASGGIVNRLEAFPCNILPRDLETLKALLSK